MVESRMTAAAEFATAEHVVADGELAIGEQSAMTRSSTPS